MGAWDFLVQSNPATIGYKIDTDRKIGELEREVGSLKEKNGKLESQVGDLKGQFRYHRSCAAAHSAVAVALREALTEVAPDHPLAGPDGQPLRQSIADKAYNDEYMNGYR